MAIFYPLLNKNKLFDTSTVIYNFPPNDYQGVSLKSRYLSLLSIKGDKWETNLIKEMSPFESFEIKYKSISQLINSFSMPILSLTEKPLKKTLENLPLYTIPNTTPEWRATISIHRKGNSSSYQGEIQPFPANGTLLSFSNFLQKKNKVKNYLIFINTETKPKQREADLILTQLDNPKNKIDKINVKSNTCNLIDLNKYKIKEDQILVIYSSQISGIPIFFSYSEIDNSISFEHTHPPASFIIYGDRREFQKNLKKQWFKFLEE